MLRSASVRVRSSAPRSSAAPQQRAQSSSRSALTQTKPQTAGRALQNQSSRSSSQLSLNGAHSNGLTTFQARSFSMSSKSSTSQAANYKYYKYNNDGKYGNNKNNKNTWSFFGTKNNQNTTVAIFDQNNTENNTEENQNNQANILTKMHDTFILALMGLLTFAIISADDKDSAPSLRQTILGTYENRIREMSAPEKVFDYFASVKRGNEKLMTPFDFIRAITPYNFRADTPVGAGTKIAKSIEQAQEIPEFFKLIDADGDGYISYGEFIFFTTLLAIPERYFYIAFQVIDENGDGRIDQTEFKKMMYSFRRQTPAGAAQRSHDAQVDNAPILPVFFGKDGTRSLRYSIFAEFLRQLRNNVLRLEFDQIDFNKSGSISARDFAMSILAYGNIRNLQQYHERAERLKDRPERITFDEYASFQKVLTNIDDINVAIEMFLEMGEPFTKYDLKRAAKAVASVELSEPSLDLLFFMFDENGDGRLNYDEFVGVLKGRASHGLNKPRDLGVVRFVDCFKQCWSSELGADSRAAKLPKERVPATK